MISELREFYWDFFQDEPTRELMILHDSRGDEDELDLAWILVYVVCSMPGRCSIKTSRRYVA